MKLAGLLSSLILILISYQQAKAESLCLQNFNVYGPIYAPQVNARVRLIGRELKKDGCSIIQLQEAWNDGSIDELESSLKTGYNLSMPNRKSRIGVMTATKMPLLSEKTYSFRVNSDEGFLDGVRSIANVKKAFHIIETEHQGEKIFVVNTHLHPSSSAVRITQVIDLYSWRKQSPYVSLILSGDFNAAPESIELRLLKSLLEVEDAGQKFFGGRYPAGFCTYCAKNPLGWLSDDRIFDYIFIGSGAGPQMLWTIEEFKLNLDQVAGKNLSDHLGVQVLLRKEKAPREISSTTLGDKEALKEVYLEAEKVLRISGLSTVADYIKFLEQSRLNL